MKPSLLDVVVLVHDKVDWAKLCVESVEAFTSNPYKLVLVDMASQEQKTKDWLKAMKDRGHTVVHLNENRSFSNGVNAGVLAGDSKFICILNDDAIVQEGWDAALIQDASPQHVGMVGARSNYALGAQGGAACLGDPPFLVFVCVCLRRAVWNSIGPMDEATFDGFSSEDLDYSWRIVKAGLKLKLSSAYVLHAGSRTLVSKLGTQEALNRNNEKYAARLIEKWGKDWYAEHTKLDLRILVATYSPQETVHMGFAQACMGLKQSAGYKFTFYQHTRTPIHLARTLICDFALAQGFDVLVQLDDDATFPADLLPRLMAHDKEVVCALAYQRKVPYGTVCYELDEEQMKQGKAVGRQLDNLEHTGLRKVDVSGFHVSAIRTSVIKKMRAHRCEKHPEGITAYWGGFEKLGEDFCFAVNCREIGVGVYVDTELISGHIGSPITVDEGYRAAYKAGKAL